MNFLSISLNSFYNSEVEMCIIKHNSNEKKTKYEFETKIFNNPWHCVFYSIKEELSNDSKKIMKSILSNLSKDIEELSLNIPLMSGFFGELNIKYNDMIEEMNFIILPIRYKIITPAKETLITKVGKFFNQKKDQIDITKLKSAPINLISLENFYLFIEKLSL